MRFWWVNQNQTYRQEVSGGYLWSPKRNADGGRNPFYESMREVAPGDLVLSYEGTHIRAIGVASSHCYECPKPEEFAGAGPNWNRIGWKVDVTYRELVNKVRPIESIEKLRPLLPPKYSPLQASGRGNQGVYLTEVPTLLMQALMALIGQEATFFMGVAQAEPEKKYMQEQTMSLGEWEEHLRQEVESDGNLSDTSKLAIVLARRGQGLFKQNVARNERKCRITHVDRPEHLRGSHIKPWRDSNNEERLDGENGLLLTPTIDHLFDRGFISFENDGRLLVSPVAHKDSLARMGVATDSETCVGEFSDGQKKYLDFHRNFVFLESHR